MDGFSWVDWTVLILYFFGITLLGIWLGGKQRSAKDYFLSERKVGWVPICMSIVATETSAITFISLPGIAYSSNFNFLQIALGYIVGRFFVAYWLLPRYFSGSLSTAYAFSGEIFGAPIHRLTSFTFIITRIFSDGVRLYITAVPLALIFRGYHLFQNVYDEVLYGSVMLIVGIVTLMYVLRGGIRAVIWTDFVQFFIYLLGGLIAVALLLDHSPDIRGEISGLVSEGKYSLFSTDDFWKNPYHFVWAFIGGVFLSIASHGTDQIIVQRLFVASALSSSRKALIASGFVVFIQFSLFLFIGSLLTLYYSEKMMPDEAFSMFIIQALPMGVRGIMVAGILAAAMSTLSSSISAMSNAVIFDFYANSHRGKHASEEKKLRLSKITSFIFSLILVLSSIGYIGIDSAIAMALKVASFTYGGLLTLFILAVFFQRVGTTFAIVGFLASLATTATITVFSLIPWTGYILASTFTGVLVAITAYFIQKSSRAFVKK